MAAFSGPKGSGIVIGEVHHPVEAREIFNPSWLTIPERDCIPAWQSSEPWDRENQRLHEPVCPPTSRLASGQSADAGSGAGPRSQGRLLLRHPANPNRSGPRKRLHRAWHGRPLAMEPALAWWLDSYSLAYTVSSLLNQLFGKGKEPFWQQGLYQSRSLGSSSFTGCSRNGG